jgi:hypothetical protein
MRPRDIWFYLRIFGCSLPEPHNFSCLIETAGSDMKIFLKISAVSMRPRKYYDTAGILTKPILVLIPFKGKPS